MGLIKAARSAARGLLADQWKEYFYCDAIPENILAVRGRKRTTGRSGSKKESDNIITNGSVIAVADGQCMMIVDQGKVVDVCAEPGEFTYDTSAEPSIFAGNLDDSIIETFQAAGRRITFGGDTARDQRVYYFNTKEMIGNKYGTANPVPFRVVDSRAGIDIDISIRCFGEYSYRICNPLLFYINVCGNVELEYTRSQLDSQLKTELLTALQPAFARISAMGVRYSALPGHTAEMARALNQELSPQWKETRGIELVSVGVSSVTANEEDEKMIRDLQVNAAFTDPSRAAASLARAQADAMRTAAENQGTGAAMAFMNMNMAAQAGGFNAQNLYQMAQQQASSAGQGWCCGCGQAGNTGNFCSACGSPKTTLLQSWKCSCGAVAEGKFCPECGQPRPPASQGWVCSCGAVNKGKFCSECGSKKPAKAPLYQCDKCGWEPEDPQHPPKFCPECGDPFGDEDVKN